MAPAGLWTTPSDLARYVIGVQQALAGKMRRVLSASKAADMLTPIVGPHGLGPVIRGTASHTFFTHGGANEGYRRNFIAWPNGEAVVLMTNSDNGGMLMDEVTRTLVQDGSEQAATRLGEAESQQLTDAVEFAAKHFKEQTQLPGSEDAVRHLLSGIASGKPDYDRMSPAFADLTRQQLLNLQPFVANLGALESLRFRGVGPHGADLYDAAFEKGALDMRVSAAA
jgi:hypothetical protein